MLLAGATLSDGQRVDVDVDVNAGVIAGIGKSGNGDDRSGSRATIVDLDGYTLVAASVEPHAHLDKAFLADVIVNETGDLLGAIAAMHAARDRLNLDETIERAERAARLMAANGSRLIRTHADVTTANGLTSVNALAEVRRRVADIVDIQIVALADSPVAGPGGAAVRVLVNDAIGAGADLVGGCPHLEPGGSAIATEVLLAIAAEHGVGVDLHTDETLDVGADGLGELALMVRSTGFPHPVTASHCVSLGVRPEADQRRIAAAVAEAGIAVIALPATNLYLQGRNHQQAMPRGVTAVRALREAGVTVAAGADNVQDPFYPFGRGCPFETAALMTLTTHLLPGDAWACVTDDAATATGASPQQVAVGQPADLIAVRARSLREAIAVGPEDRIVWRAGRRVPGR